MMLFRLSWLMCLSIAIESKRLFFVNDYGAQPNDDIDDTFSIQRAIFEAIKDGSDNDLIFGYGIYSISSTLLILNATNLTILGQGIDQTFLIGYNQVSIFNALHCQGLILKSFSIDYDPLPFTAGHVLAITNEYIDLQVVPPHQADVDRQVQAILRYDPLHRRPAFGSNTYEIYQTPPTGRNTTLISPNVLRLPLASSSRFLIGDPIVVRYVFRGAAIYAQDVVDLTIRSILIYASWGMGFVTLRAHRLNVIDYHVRPYADRWMSTIVDCMHFTDSKEYISIEDSECQSMGDDGLNVHGVYLLITQVIDSKTLIVTATNWTDPLDFSIGTKLEISSSKEPFTVVDSGNVSSLTFNTRNSRQVRFENPINAHVGDWACVGDTPRLTIQNFTVANNRARGALLETRNVEIRKSLFNQTSGPAILIQPSMFWHEGPNAHNITLIENRYIDNNEGIAQEKGIITILPDPIQIIPVISDIRIESSTFHIGLHSQGLLQSNNINNLSMSGNYIVTNQSSPFISICNSRNITAENNCVVNNQTKIDPYYIFDSLAPCAMNLSSLIDLPPSAFNATFSPPVLKQIQGFEL